MQEFIKRTKQVEVNSYVAILQLYLTFTRIFRLVLRNGEQARRSDTAEMCFLRDVA
jgi:hypothetical protein